VARGGAASSAFRRDLSVNVSRGTTSQSNLVSRGRRGQNSLMRSALSGLVLVLVGCTSGVGPSQPSSVGSPLPVAQADPPTVVEAPLPGARVFGQLRTRDRRVTLMTSQGGLRLTVQDKAGTVLARDVTVDDLAKSEPILHEVLRSSVATREPYLDARLYVPPPTREQR
jgi:hypothetical protein